MDRYRNKLKRVADALEKLGVAGLAIGFYQDSLNSAFWLGLVFMAASLILTEGGAK